MKQSIIGFILALVFYGLPIRGHAQTSEAKQLLEATIDRMQSPEGVKATVTMQMYFGSELETEQSATLMSKGDRIRMENEEVTFISDGTSTWTIMPSQESVQINDFSSDEFSAYSPATMLDYFQQGEFTYDIVQREGGIARIDFKPNDRDSEYAKISVFIEEDKKVPTAIMIVQKDGVRYNVTIDNIDLKTTIDDGTFTFDAANYPDYIIDDFRLGE